MPPPPIVGTSEEGRLGVYYRLIEPGDPFSVTSGALIITAWPGGPADGAGLEAGDIILQVGQQNVTGRQTLEDMVQRYQAGEVITVRVLKAGGGEISVRVRLSN
jgi:S1-C subfamily serine protease